MKRYDLVPSVFQGVPRVSMAERPEGNADSNG